MRRLVAILLSMSAAACGANPAVTLAPHEPAAPLVGMPLLTALDVTVVDASGRLIEGAEVILQSEPAPRRATTLSAGVVRFVGLFIVEPRFFIACAPGFVCSKWIDRRAAGFGSLTQTVVLQKATVDVPPLPPPLEAR